MITIYGWSTRSSEVKWPRSVARCGVTVRSRHVEVPRRDREVVGEQDQSPNGELTTAVTTT
jgi:hypothetical protein